MIIHYIKISIRGALKYKTQTLISICAIAVSVSLFVLVTSLSLRIHPHPIYERSTGDNIVEIENNKNSFDKEQLRLIETHNFKSAEKVIPKGYGRWANLITVFRDNDSQRSKFVEGHEIHGELPNFLGYKSEVTGKPVQTITGDTVLLSRNLAEKLYGNCRVAIGKQIFVGEKECKESYYIKDVISDPYLSNGYFRIADIYLPIDHAEKFYCTGFIAKIRNGFNKDDLNKELYEIFPDDQIRVKHLSRDEITWKLRYGFIIFLFLFLLVSVTNLLRQKVQIFQIRQREIALRTALGAKESQLFAQLFLDVSLVISISFLLSLTLSFLIKNILITKYYSILSRYSWNVNHIFPITLVIYAIIMVLSALTVAIFVQHIKKDRTGLALQIKPRPRHHLRNIGLTLQTIIFMLFTWITILVFNSSLYFENYLKVPDNDDFYRQGLYLRLNAVETGIKDNIFKTLKKSESIDKLYCEEQSFEPIVENYNKKAYQNYIKVYIQTSNEVIDFYNIEIDTIRYDANPTLNVIVSENLKLELEKSGMWNNMIITIGDQTYDIIGTFKQMPYDVREWQSVIITDFHHIPSHTTFYIIPKSGYHEEVKKYINETLTQYMSHRIDIVAEDLYLKLLPESSIYYFIKFIIYVITGVSLVTTTASLYASVTLDTRRRRKEMALRKINGAKTTDICRIFAKTYVWITIIAGIITFSVCGIATKIRLNDTEYFPHPIQDCCFAIVFVIAVTFTTIAWKIREVMKVEPAEYLKE